MPNEKLTSARQEIQAETLKWVLLFQGRYVLARIFGATEGLFERAKEQRIFSGVANAGLGPQLLVIFAIACLEWVDVLQIFHEVRRI